MVFSLSFFIFLFLPRPPRCLHLPRPPLIPANRFRLKLVAGQSSFLAVVVRARSPFSGRW